MVAAIQHGVALEALSLAQLKQFSDVIEEDVYPVLSLQSCLDKRNARGGVAPQQVALAIREAQARLQ